MKRLIIINIFLIVLFSIIPNVSKVVEVVEQVVKEVPVKQVSNRGTTTSRKEEKVIKNTSLTVNSDLRELSNLTAEDFNKMLKGTGLSGTGKTLAKIEKEYKINALYLMGLACEESAYGNSSMAKNRNNCTGYCAYDSDTNKAKYFNSLDDCLMTTAKLLKTKYLTSGAVYFNGYTPRAIDKKYCTDKSHADKIIQIVNRLIKKL